MSPTTGLILSGGGARAAYQVGVLAGIAELLPPGAPNPFPVIVGTSAGAINAVTLASGATRFTDTVQNLTAFWQNLRSHRVLRSDWPGWSARPAASSATACWAWAARRRWRCSTAAHCVPCCRRS